MKPEEQFDIHNLAHGSKLENKCKSSTELRPILSLYKEFIRDITDIKITNEAGVRAFVRRFNKYRSAVVNDFEERENSGQENLRSSMLEEFFQHLFREEVKEVLGERPTNLILGKANSYVDLSFIPESFQGLYKKPSFYIHTKDQDFVIGANVTISISIDNASNKSDTVIPVVAIECKTYIESNMLDSCAGTASRIKSAMPYCLYFVAAEYMKMEDARPELTDINEVFILTKASVSDRGRQKANKLPTHIIDSDVVWSLFLMVDRHLRAIWWDPASALKRGRIIGRP